MLIALPLHVLRELLKAVALSLLVFGFVLLVVPIGQMIRDGVGVWTTLTNIPLMFPLISPLLLPVAMITSVLVCYGRLAGDNEYTAAQAAGVHPGWVVMPSLCVALLATAISLYLNDEVINNATNAIRRSIIADRAQILSRRLQRPGSFRLADMAFVRLRRNTSGAAIDISRFAESADTKGEDPRWDPEYPHAQQRILARNHEIGLLETESGALYVRAELTDSREMNLEGSGLQLVDSQSHVLHISVDHENQEVSVDPNRISNWGIRKIAVALRERRDEIAGAEKQRDAAQPNSSEFSIAQNRLESLRKSEMKLTSELHFKLAMSFSCLGLVLVGVPLGLRMRAQRTMIGFAVGIALAAGYFLMIKGLQTWSRSGLLPADLIWLPNLLLIAAAAWLLFSRKGD